MSPATPSPDDGRLQQFDKGDYERPDRPYQCGHSCEGIRCLLGPTPKGQCQADYECEPIQKNSKWICTRTKLQGGKCEDGPSANGTCCQLIPDCSPVPSLRIRRSRFVKWCVAATIGLLMLTLSAPWRDSVIKPGELTQNHAQILKEQSSGRCSACHQAAETGLASWTVSTIVPGQSLGGAQSVRCLKCHEEKLLELPDADALRPHGISEKLMATRTVATCERLGLDQPRRVATLHDGQIECAACHREHHGTLHNLSAMTNAQCASCHQDQFSNFANGHPEFDQWPYERRTRIAFDHVSHQAKYFAENKQSFECRSCHVQSEAGTITGVTSFETACASCHKEKIQLSLGEGVALLQLPMIDRKALKSKELEVGEWPDAASGDFDGELPSLTRVLLNTDPFARAALEQFGPHFEFLDVDSTSIDDLEAVHDIVWGIKYLVYDLVKQGPPALATRLSQAMDTELEEKVAKQLTGHISPAAIRQLQRAWFPNLIQEVEARRANRQLPKPVNRVEAVAESNETGWIRDDTEYALRYRPSGHASEFLSTWIEATGQTNRAELSEDFQVLWKEMTSSSANGLCITCHSVETNPAVFGAKIVNWHARQLTSDEKRFTKFSHDPHVILPGLKDCTACHALNPNARTTDSYAGEDPFAFESSFLPVEKASCANCHHPQAASDSCTECHNYHVNSP